MFNDDFWDKLEKEDEAFFAFLTMMEDLGLDPDGGDLKGRHGGTDDWDKDDWDKDDWDDPDAG